MDNEILSLIEDLINNKNNEKINKLSLKIGIDISQTLLFINYFKKFTILSTILDSEYVILIRLV